MSFSLTRTPPLRRAVFPFSHRPPAPSFALRRPPEVVKLSQPTPNQSKSSKFQRLQCRLQRPCAYGGPGQEPRTERQQRASDQKIILGLGLALTGAICSVAYFGGDSLLAEVSTWEVLDLGGDASLGAGDIVGALLWSVGLYFASPLQLLLLFIGQVDNERPSDALLRFFGKLGGLSVEAKDYRAPAWAQAATVAVCALCGASIAAALGSWLGDPSWSISTGIGACMAAGMYEVGRPQRLSVEEAQLLEQQYQDFVAFADERLQRTGRCHESEVIRGFRRTKGRYRRATGPDSVISDSTIRDMIRSWHRRADRTGSGYYKNLSFRPVPSGGTGVGQPIVNSAAEGL